MNNPITLIIVAISIIGIILFIRSAKNKKKALQEKLNEKFPIAWRNMLKKSVFFYAQLNEADASLFEKRVQLFIATKQIEGIETEIDDSIRLMVACSAIIPTFAFPKYNYPYVHTILIYPNSFDEKFQTERFEGHKEIITGMVDSRNQNGTVILSKPDLVRAFDGLPHKENVGIHEFVHLLDKEDGAIDGIPEALLKHQFVGPWLHEIKNEIARIEKGKSDINPYALTNNAEFLAVVSEYFFSNPEKFKNKHLELYQFLSCIFNQDTVKN
jgi:Mlc titration factor MtfA (ptsG expression regulator)